MDTPGSVGLWQHIDRAERAFCGVANRGCRHRVVRDLFVAVSRLGDGPFWYVLMLALALSGPEGARVAAQMAATAIACLLLYRQLKRRLVRERPYLTHDGIVLGTAPLDKSSFPSGHTLHAVCFTTLAIAHAPALAPLLVPFMLLVAASRVVLGLHYPSDVAAGALIGLLVATASLSAWPA